MGTVKPLDWEAVRGHAAVCGGRVVTVEDHYPEGGLGDAVLASLAMVRNVVVKKLAVNAVPRSGPPTELLEMFGISASHIVKACYDILKMWNNGLFRSLPPPSEINHVIN